MLEELEGNRLDVVLTPARYGNGKIRVVQGQNAEWYRRLCRHFTAGRGRMRFKHDTRLKRANVVAILRRLIAGKSTTSYLAHYLCSEAKARGLT